MFKIIIQAKKRILPAFIMVEIPPSEQISNGTIASLKKKDKFIFTNYGKDKP